MIIYSSTKKGFIDDAVTNQIEKKVLACFIRESGHSTGKAELASWKYSLQYMNNIVSDPEIPDNAGVAIEYTIPRTSKRVDFILTGKDIDQRKIAIIVELKQWQKAEMTGLDGIVRTFVAGNNREVSHPSYQVWSYAILLEDYNSSIEDENISLKPCAYLHNYERDNVIENDFYKEYTEKAPVFLKDDVRKLQAFIKQFVKYGDNGDLMYTIEHGKIRPSKSLSDSLASMIDGNPEFILLDEQKLVYETALKLAKESTATNKNVLIVEGGPGTGKTVVAMNLLAKLINRGDVTQYVTKNSAPRKVYQVKLTGKFTLTRIANLFTSSGSFHDDILPNTFDSLIIDEAHRLSAKSGYVNHLGENQIKELIDAAKFTIFFIDEDQRVTLQDIGQNTEIIKWAHLAGAKVHILELASQFRCNGSDGYLSWLDNVLQIRETANDSLDDIAYDFQVMDNPISIHQGIIQKNNINNKARMLAGYCWKWISKKNPQLRDIVIGDYAASWNLYDQGQAWIIHPDSVNEVGCIHTCQGLELDYVGVIIGPDMVVRNGEIITDASKRASTDKSVSGYKKMFKEDPIKAKALGDMIIKNTYRTLMTRGMKGCYIYCTDQETQEYFREQLRQNKNADVTYTNIPHGASLNIDKT
jgi:DUF2075 family protein